MTGLAWTLRPDVTIGAAAAGTTSIPTIWLWFPLVLAAGVLYALRTFTKPPSGKRTARRR